MAKNNMNPLQDVITRDFMRHVLSDNNLFPDDPVGQKQCARVCLRLLNYTVVDGKYVDPKRVTTRKFAGSAQVQDEWGADELRARRMLNEENNNTGADQADSSVASTDTEVREAVLREDV